MRRGGSGVQTYARELLRELPAAMDAEFVAVVQADATGEVPPSIATRTRRPCDGVRRTLESLRPVGACDLVHGLDVDLPLRPGAPTVTTVHDLALFDTPWAFGRLRRAGKRLTTGRAVRSADAVIAVSAFTAERVKARFGRDAVVVHEAPGPAFGPPPPGAVSAFRARHDLPERFVAYVGNLEPRKDLPTLAAACSIAGLPLVLAGAALPGTFAPEGARCLGHVSAGDLPAFYAAATVVAYVSRYEGFGLPPLEAMACGAAVMATPVGALPEVAGEGAEFVPAGDPEAQGEVLRALAADADRRAARAAAGLAAARALSWGVTAAATADVYRSLL